jgi:hypothetical protein
VRKLGYVKGLASPLAFNAFVNGGEKSRGQCLLWVPELEELCIGVVNLRAFYLMSI